MFKKQYIFSFLLLFTSMLQLNAMQYEDYVNQRRLHDAMMRNLIGRVFECDYVAAEKLADLLNSGELLPHDIDRYKLAYNLILVAQSSGSNYAG